MVVWIEERNGKRELETVAHGDTETIHGHSNTSESEATEPYPTGIFHALKKESGAGNVLIKP